MTGPKLVQLRGGAPLLNDIPGQLELLAKEIREGKVSYQRILIVGENDEGDVEAYGHGVLRTMAHDIGLLELAKDLITACGVNVAPEDDPPPGAA